MSRATNGWMDTDCFLVQLPFSALWLFKGFDVLGSGDVGSLREGVLRPKPRPCFSASAAPPPRLGGAGSGSPSIRAYASSLKNERSDFLTSI